MASSTPTLPKSLTTENRVLHKLMCSKDRNPIIFTLKEEDFSDIYRRLLFLGFESLTKKNTKFDDVMVLKEAKLISKFPDDEKKRLENIWSEIAAGAGTPNIEDEVKDLKRYTLKRQLVELSSSSLAESKKDVPDIGKIITEANDARLGKVTVIESFDDALDDYKKMENEKIKVNDGRVLGASLVFEEFDNETSGVVGGEIAVIAGRPGAGKSAYLVQIAMENAKRGKRCLYFSLEMLRQEVIDRILAYFYADNSRFYSAPRPENIQEITQKVDGLKSLPINIYDNIFDIDQIISNIYYHKEIAKTEFVIIDYLQLIDVKKSFPTDNSRVSYISRQLKIASQQANIPIIIGSQFSRATEHREDQRPMLSDLRDSGSIEQDASVVLALHQHDVYKQLDNEESFVNESERNKKITDSIIMLKNRKGRSFFNLDVIFYPEKSTFDLKK